MANRYWVGGTATWDNSTTANWSAASGSTPGASVPGSGDVAIFDAASGTNVVTLNYAPTLGAMNLTGFTGTLNFSSNVISVAFNNANVFVGGSTATLSGTPTINCTYSGATGTRTINIGALGESNAVNVNVSAGTDIVALQTSSGAYKNINFTGFSGSLTLSASIYVFGDLTISTGMTVNASTAVPSFRASSGTQKIKTNGKTVDFGISIGSGTSTNTVQLQDNCTVGSTRTVTLTNGALDLNNNTLSCGLFSSSNSNTRSIAFGTGNITLTGNAGTIWNTGTITGLTYTGTPTVNATYSGATGTRTFTSGYSAISLNGILVNLNVTAGTDTITSGGTSFFGSVDFTGFSGTFSNVARNYYGDLKLSSTMTMTDGTGVQSFLSIGTQKITTNGITFGGPMTFNGIGGIFQFQDALTQAASRSFTITNGTVQLKAGVTSTIGAFATSGTAQKFLQSTTLGSQATLSQASGTVDVSYLTIRDINATGGATWNAFVDQNNVDAGNVDGWNFGISPVVGGNEYTYQLRSFTQPRRF